MENAALPRLQTAKQRKRERERRFKPLAEEIGWIAFEWNRLQETLAELFAAAVGGEQLISFPVWHAVRSDLTQREMLKAAVNYRIGTANEKRKPVWQELLWVANEATNLSHKRNDAIHVPFMFVTNFDANSVDVMPLFFLGNPKAEKLAPKDLAKEFRWYRNSAATLADYAMVLQYAVNFPEDYPSPKRPVMPSLGQKETPTRSPRRSKPK